MSQGAIEIVEMTELTGIRKCTASALHGGQIIEHDAFVGAHRAKNIRPRVNTETSDRPRMLGN